MLTRVAPCLPPSLTTGKHVVFGRVLRGMEYVEAIVGVAGTASGTPSRRVVIADCGQLGCMGDVGAELV